MLPSFDVTPYGTKCRFPIAEVDGITIAVLLCQAEAEHLGLLLHPAPDNEILDPSHKLYYVSWAFCQQNGHGYESRVAFLGGDLHDLRFRGQRVTATWREIYIITHPSKTGRRDGVHLLHGFQPDVALIPFRIPQTLLRTLGALGFFPVTRSISSKDALRFTCENSMLMESFCILLGTCSQASTNTYTCHWAWAEYHNDAGKQWGLPWTHHVHNCATDHIDGWPERTREFCDTAHTIRLVFSPCPHAPKWTLVLGLELVGSVYKRIQREANVYLPPQQRRLTEDAPVAGVQHPILPEAAESSSIIMNNFRNEIRSLRVQNTTQDRKIWDLEERMRRFPDVPRTPSPIPNQPVIPGSAVPLTAPARPLTSWQLAFLTGVSASSAHTGTEPPLDESLGKRFHDPRSSAREASRRA